MTQQRAGSLRARGQEGPGHRGSARNAPVTAPRPSTQSAQGGWPEGLQDGALPTPGGVPLNLRNRTGICGWSPSDAEARLQDGGGGSPYVARGPRRRRGGPGSERGSPAGRAEFGRGWGRQGGRPAAPGLARELRAPQRRDDRRGRASSERGRGAGNLRPSRDVKDQNDAAAGRQFGLRLQRAELRLGRLPAARLPPAEPDAQGRLLPPRAAAGARGAGQPARGPPPPDHHQRGRHQVLAALDHAGRVPADAAGPAQGLHQLRRHPQRVRRLRRHLQRVLLRPQPGRLRHHPHLPARRQAAAAARDVRPVLPGGAALLGRRRGPAGPLLPAPLPAEDAGVRRGGRAGARGAAAQPGPRRRRRRRRPPGPLHAAPARHGGAAALGAARQGVRLPVGALRHRHGRQPLGQHPAQPAGGGGAGPVLPDVPQRVHRGVGVRGLVLPGVPPAAGAGAAQVRLPAEPADAHRPGGHPALLRDPAGGRRGRGPPPAGRGQQLPGQGGAAAARAAGAAHPVRDAPGAPLARAADAGAHGAPLHARVRAAAALPVRGHRALRPAALRHRERDGRQPRVHQHPRLLLVGRHHHDDRGLRRHGAPEHAGAGGGAQQHPQRHPAHGLPGDLHLPHLLALLPGAQAGAGKGDVPQGPAPHQNQVAAQRPVPGQRHPVRKCLLRHPGPQLSAGATPRRPPPAAGRPGLPPRGAGTSTSRPGLSPGTGAARRPSHRHCPGRWHPPLPV